MTRVFLLEHLKTFTEETLADLLLPVPPPRHTICVDLAGGDDFDDGLGGECANENAEQPEPSRVVKVFTNALPKGSSVTRDAPYVLHQILKTLDFQKPGQLPLAEILVRTTFCIYHEDGQEGGLSLLNAMERLRIGLLRRRVIGKQFRLDLSAGLETLVYPDTGPPPEGTAPYYLGEMLTTWNAPIIEREVDYDKTCCSNIRKSGPGPDCNRTGPGAHGEYITPEKQ